VCCRLFFIATGGGEACLKGMSPLLALAGLLAATPPTPAPFAPGQAPLRPEEEPHAAHFVNRDRVYDFYAKQALAFGGKETLPALLPPFPGLDQGKHGHQGNQNDRDTWKDGRWGASDFGNLFSGVFRGAGLTLPKAVWVSDGARHAVFDPATLAFRARWTGGFVKLGDLRHGFNIGASPGGTAAAEAPAPAARGPDDLYRGFYRHGSKVIFSYRKGGKDFLATAEDGERPAAQLAHLTRGGPSRWPLWVTAGGKLGQGKPIATDALHIPFKNPYGTLFFLAGLDFLPDGTLAVCTMTGEVWLIKGADGDLSKARWKRFATGLHQPLGIRTEGGRLLVVGRDQVTRLHDLNGDDEADFHECVADGMATSDGGHDFIVGLERDAQGRLYTASGNQGLLRLTPGKPGAEVLATGLRNPNGIGLSPDGRFLTSSLQEGNWTPASAIVQVDLAAAGARHFGLGGPRDGKPIDLPLLQMPRGEDNSSAGQVFLGAGRWPGLAGPSGNLVHFSYGSASAWLVTRQLVDGVWQGAATRLGASMSSGAQQGRFHPRDGHLYVTGLTGWQTYTPDDGSLHRLRHTGGAPLPVAHAVHANGVRIDFDLPLEAAAAGRAAAHFAQCWNYREPTGAYGSPEFSVRHPGTPGHDPLAIRAAHVLEGGRGIFLEIPEITVANQVHLRVATSGSRAVDLFLTAHRLAPDFTAFPGYVARPKSAHEGHAATPPASGNTAAMRPIPWESELCEQPTRPVLLRAGTGLQFETKELRARRGEWIALTFENPDGMSHNWLLARPGSADRVADLAGKLAGQADAHARHYAPDSDDVLVHTRVVDPGKSTLIRFQAPAEPGRYPYLCTLPGHAVLMRGELVVE